MSSHVAAEVRRLVAQRAQYCCEYCLVHQDDAVTGHQVDHVIAEKHGGPTSADNLALSCTVCNLRKASDLSSIDPETGHIVPLFNPRMQSWNEHFRIVGLQIVGTTASGRTTVEFLKLNTYERMAERRELLIAGRFPIAPVDTVP
jgi:5-methylcytosine-specific restriction endonuclease McrA